MDVPGVLARAADRALATAPAPPAWLLAVTTLAALVLVAHRRTWPLARHAVTIAHEGGHATAAALSGRRLRGIRLHSDTSGVTISAGRPQGAGAVATTAAGYPAPALVGLGAAALLADHRPAAVAWAVLAALALVLVQLRNAFGALLVLVAAAGALALSWWAPPPVVQVVALVLAEVLLLGAVRASAELVATRRGGRAPASDADQLGRLTGLPAALCALLFVLLTALATVAGAWLLVRLSR